MQASNYLSTDPEVADYLSHGDRQLQCLAYFLEHSPAQFSIYRDTEGDLFSTWRRHASSTVGGFEKGRALYLYGVFHH